MSMPSRSTCAWPAPRASGFVAQTVHRCGGARRRGWTFTIPTTGPGPTTRPGWCASPVATRDERQRGNGWDTAPAQFRNALGVQRNSAAPMRYRTTGFRCNRGATWNPPGLTDGHARAWAAVVLLFHRARRRIAGDRADPTAARRGGADPCAWMGSDDRSRRPCRTASRARSVPAVAACFAARRPGLALQAHPWWTQTPSRRRRWDHAPRRNGRRLPREGRQRGLLAEHPEQHAAAEASRMAHPTCGWPEGPRPRPDLSKAMRPPVLSAQK